MTAAPFYFPLPSPCPRRGSLRDPTPEKAGRRGILKAELRYRKNPEKQKLFACFPAIYDNQNIHRHTGEARYPAGAYRESCTGLARPSSRDRPRETSPFYPLLQKISAKNPEEDHRPPPDFHTASNAGYSVLTLIEDGHNIDIIRVLLRMGVAAHRLGKGGSGIGRAAGAGFSCAL